MFAPKRQRHTPGSLWTGNPGMGTTVLGRHRPYLYTFIYGGLLEWGYPKNAGWFISWKNPVKYRWWLGVPLFQDTSIYIYIYIYIYVYMYMYIYVYVYVYIYIWATQFFTSSTMLKEPTSCYLHGTWFNDLFRPSLQDDIAGLHKHFMGKLHSFTHLIFLLATSVPFSK